MSAPGRTVFVVDDDAVLLFILRGVLLAAGYRVEVFDHPEGLLARITASDRGCIVLDLNMPELSGLEVQKALHCRGVLLPLIFVSGRADIPAVVAALKSGAVDFLAKPIEPRELAAAVERALRKDAEIEAELAARARACALFAGLSPRERDVCRWFAKGLSDKQIAAELGTTAVTVQAQRARALRKLEANMVNDVVKLLAQVGEEGGG